MHSGEMDLYAVCICIGETGMMRIVVLQIRIAMVVRDCEMLFSVTKDTFDELIQLSEMFEQCISNALDNISLEEETVPTDLDGTGVLLMKGAIMNTQKYEQLWFVQRETSIPTMQV